MMRTTQPATQNYGFLEVSVIFNYDISSYEYVIFGLKNETIHQDSGFVSVYEAFHQAEAWLREEEWIN